MPVHLEALQAFRLGQNAEILRTFGLLANLRISREQAYIGIVQQAELIDVKLPSYSESDSPNNLLELIMTVVRFYRPDLIDPFMTGCCSGKVFWLSKLAIEVPDIGTGDDWQHDWDNTVRALYFGASKVGILRTKGHRLDCRSQGQPKTNVTNATIRDICWRGLLYDDEGINRKHDHQLWEHGKCQSRWRADRRPH